jgi:hypothetical protein
MYFVLKLQCEDLMLRHRTFGAADGFRILFTAAELPLYPHDIHGQLWVVIT